jgi:hypothetical protein
MKEFSNVVSFRQLLRERFPEAHVLPAVAEALRLGIPCLEELGVRPGCIHEIVAQQAGAGSALLLTALLEGAGEAVRQPVALVDGADGFDPLGVTSETRERLLWLRCRDAVQAVRVTDELLRDGNLMRVLVDLVLCPARQVRQIPAQAWHRLRLLTEKSGAVCCVFTSFQTVSCAWSRLVLDRPHGLEALDTSRGELLPAIRGRLMRRGTVAA